jgi:hypothetical protein
LLAIFSISAQAAAVPEPFAGHDPNSTFRIKYSDVDTILKTMVVDLGRSTRQKAKETTAKTGTRMKKKVKRETANEGNRFFYEEFENNQEYKDILHQVRLSLEAIPSQVPLAAFNRKEQLAYWLNLYNVTVLDVLVQQYPERDLKKELIGKKSFLDDKILNVAGVPLSLNDIQYTILAGNYDNDPRIMYGLYQGNIGGPNIRKRAYSGENVDRFLQDNAEEFVNSNRGTTADEDTFEVSTLYERNSQYFPSFDRDLKEHLMRYISGPERSALQAANTLKPDIDDWTITDIYGTDSQIGGSFSDSRAAMLDSVVTQQPGPDGGAAPPISASFSGASSAVQAKTPDQFRFDQQLLEQLSVIKQKELDTNMRKEGTVTVEELGEVKDEGSEEDDGASNEDYDN